MSQPTKRPGSQLTALSRRSSNIQQTQMMTEAKPLPLGVPAFKPIPMNSHQDTFEEVIVLNNNNNHQNNILVNNRRSGIDYPLQTNVQSFPNRRNSDINNADVTKNTIQSMISPLAHVSIF